MPTLKKSYSVSEVSEMWGCTGRIVLGHISSGRLGAVNIGCGTERPRWMIRETDLTVFIDAQSTEKAKENVSE